MTTVTVDEGLEGLYRATVESTRDVQGAPSTTLVMARDAGGCLWASAYHQSEAVPLPGDAVTLTEGWRPWDETGEAARVREAMKRGT